MDKQQARNLIKETFEGHFDKARFTVFIKNLLNHSEDAPFTYKGQYIPDAYQPYVSSMERLAKYSDGEHTVDILIIRLKRETSLERARTMQRNFVAWYLNGSRGGELKDAALVAFVSPDSTDWRFSLVKMDYRLTETKTGKMKVKEEFTPARRWSFLVGVSEKSHTAQSRLINILANDEQSPTLDELEEAFNIETVTREFFLKYRDLFIRTKQALDNILKRDGQIKSDLEAKGINTVDFAKKLLGQIVFLYFLQKKGWFGVKANETWGDGSKQFLRELFEGKHGSYKNFFNDILEPLFYDALSRDRSDIDHWNDHFKCKIPFLNGGLFDPIGNYNWHSTDILLPNELFSNRKNSRDEGTGILDIFDLYNFTVKEDEPMEKEVAIDPELLGKAYEKFNAIRPDNFEKYIEALQSGKLGDESKFNKQFGVYYTPREIVHYMCQESLINYLATECSDESRNCPISKEDIATLIHFGEQVRENEVRVQENGRETKAYSYKLPESIRNNARLLDIKLADINVCDPAVGSGAFPVGMMTEIVKARNVLSAFIDDEERTPYNFKRHCIQHSLYGVDYDPGAVEIAKLRLWLSLVVDEDDIRQIKPLPNLDYKIMQGNSLVEEFEGIKLFDEKLIADVDFNKEKQIRALKERQSAYQKEYFELHSEGKLTTDRQSILNTELKRINASLKKLSEPHPIINASLFDSVNAAKQKARQLNRLHKDFFETTGKQKKDELKKKISDLEWELIEATLKEVGNNAGLVKIEEFKKSNIKPFFLWKLHFSEIFQEKGGFDVIIANPPYIQLSKVEGIPTWYKDYLRSRFRTSGGRLNTFIFFTHLALDLLKNGGHLAFIIPNTILTQEYYSATRELLLRDNRLVTIVQYSELPFEAAVVENVSIIVQKSILPEYQIQICVDDLTCINNVAWKSNTEFLANGNFSISVNSDKLIDRICTNYKKTLESICDINQAIALKGDRSLSLRSDNPANKYYKKLDGKNIGRYSIAWDGMYLDYDVKKIHSCKRKDIFLSKEKLFFRRVSESLMFAYDNEQYFALNTLVVVNAKRNINVNLKCILAIMNSRLMNYIYKGKFKSTKTVFSEIQANTVGQLPIAEIDPISERSLLRLVDRVLALKHANASSNTDLLEQEIDNIIYQLYGLTSDEINIVEGVNS